MSEVIHCKDCRFCETVPVFVDGKVEKHYRCTLYMDAYSPWCEASYMPEGDDFCSRAERREE